MPRERMREREANAEAQRVRTAMIADAGMRASEGRRWEEAA